MKRTLKALSTLSVWSWVESRDEFFPELFFLPTCAWYSKEFSFRQLYWPYLNFCFTSDPGSAFSYFPLSPLTKEVSFLFYFISTFWFCSCNSPIFCEKDSRSPTAHLCAPSLVTKRSTQHPTPRLRWVPRDTRSVRETRILSSWCLRETGSWSVCLFRHMYSLDRCSVASYEW